MNIELNVIIYGFSQKHLLKLLWSKNVIESRKKGGLQHHTNLWWIYSTTTIMESGQIVWNAEIHW